MKTLLISFISLILIGEFYAQSSTPGKDTLNGKDIIVIKTDSTASDMDILNQKIDINTISMEQQVVIRSDRRTSVPAETSEQFKPVTTYTRNPRGYTGKRGGGNSKSTVRSKFKNRKRVKKSKNRRCYIF